MAVVALLAVLLQVLRQSPSTDVSVKEPKDKGIRVEIQTSPLRSYEPVSAYPAVLRAKKDVDLKAERAGQVIYTNGKNKGKELEARTPIVKLDLKALLATEKSLEKSISYYQQQLDTEEKLKTKGLSSITRYLKVEAELAQAQAQLKQVQETIKDSTIVMPFDGVLEQIYVSRGSYVGVGEAVAHVADLSTLKALLKIPEASWSKARLAKKAHIKVGDALYPAEIAYISRSADKKTRSYVVELLLSNEKNLPQGLSVTAHLVLPETQAHQLPHQVLTLDENGKIGVKTVENKSVKFYPISVVDDTKDAVWVTGLPEKDIDVIVNGFEYVKDGQEVQAVPKV